MAGTVYVDNIITDTGTTVNVSNVQFTTSGQIRSVAGSASTPGISVQNNTNTGIFFPAANTIAFAEGGVESLRITNEGTLSTNTAGVAGIQLYQDTNDPTASSRLFFTSNTASSVLLQSAANLAFLTGATLGSTSGIRRIDFNAFGITLGGSGAASSGMGIKFPASQSASSDPNSLDDYEEGDWTPNVTAFSGTYTTLGTRTGTYIKVGRLVSVCFTVAITTIGTGSLSGFSVTNLPFTTQNVTSGNSPGVGIRASDALILVFQSAQNTTQVDCYASGSANFVVAGVTYRFQMTYFTS